jgi:hypothetical protein
MAAGGLAPACFLTRADIIAVKAQPEYGAVLLARACAVVDAFVERHGLRHVHQVARPTRIDSAVVILAGAEYLTCTVPGCANSPWHHQLHEILAHFSTTPDRYGELCMVVLSGKATPMVDFVTVHDAFSCSHP